jgi:hypothetical protein
MKKHGSKPEQAVLMRYPHIRGTVVAVEWQPSFIHLWPGIGCPDFLRPFEDTPSPSTIGTLKYSYAHSGVAVGFFAPCAQPRCRGPPSVSEICSQPNFRIRRNHTDAIKDVLIPPDVTPQRQCFTYANEADVLNVALFGITAKEWRQTHPDSKGNIRDEASLQQLIVLANLESINAELIRQGIPQSERLLRLNASAKQMMQSLVGDHRIDEFRTYGELPNKKSK